MQCQLQLGSSSYNNILCNNCGKVGHAFYQCKHPITSVGVVVFRYNAAAGAGAGAGAAGATGKVAPPPGLPIPVPLASIINEREYLLIRRRYSIGYMEFIRGKYQLYNKLYLVNLVSEMTDSERHAVLTQNFEELWQTLWGDHVGMQYRNEETNSRDKFEALKSGLSTFQNGDYSINSLIDECEVAGKHWDEPEWGFPKGRHDRKENDLLCALREFEEETGYDRSALQLVHNILPLEEIFTGSNYKSYKHKYYIAALDPTTAVPPAANHFSGEVGAMAWMPYSVALAHIRPYNVEKRELLSRVDQILATYQLSPANSMGNNAM